MSLCNQNRTRKRKKKINKLFPKCANAKEEEEKNGTIRDEITLESAKRGTEKKRRTHTYKHFLSFSTRDGWKRVDERAKTQKEKQINNKEEEEGKTFVVGGEIKVYVQPNSKRR